MPWPASCNRYGRMPLKLEIGTASQAAEAITMSPWSCVCRSACPGLLGPSIGLGPPIDPRLSDDRVCSRSRTASMHATVLRTGLVCRANTANAANSPNPDRDPCEPCDPRITGSGQVRTVCPAASDDRNGVMRLSASAAPGTNRHPRSAATNTHRPRDDLTESAELLPVAQGKVSCSTRDFYATSRPATLQTGTDLRLGSLPERSSGSTLSGMPRLLHGAPQEGRSTGTIQDVQSRLLPGRLSFRHYGTSLVEELSDTSDAAHRNPRRVSNINQI